MGDIQRDVWYVNKSCRHLYIRAYLCAIILPGDPINHASSHSQTPHTTELTIRDMYTPRVVDKQACSALLKTFMKLYLPLANFYNSPNMMCKRMDLRNALRSEWDRAFHELVKMAKGMCHLKKDPSAQVFFFFGLGDVGGHGGPCIRFLIRKLKGLGYDQIYAIDEFCTSQFCPCCGCHVKDVDDTRDRIKYCYTDKGCGRYFHRDKMAGVNIAYCGERELRERDRPTRFTRPTSGRN